MLTFEKLIADNLFQLILIVAGGIIAFAKLQQWQGIAMKQMTEMKKSHEDHLEDVAPHAACSAHATRLQDIVKGIEEIKQKLCTMDDRIYEMIKGRSK